MPQNVVISEERFRRDERIGFILDKHPEVFKNLIQSEHLVLIFFVMTELIKGEDSFWAPYFATTEKTDLLLFWNNEVLLELQDEVLRIEAQQELE